MSSIQAILFDRDYFNVKQVNEFMKRNKLTKIKPYHLTKNIRARLLTPNYKKYYYRIGTIDPHIDVIYEFKKSNQILI